MYKKSFIFLIISAILLIVFLGCGSLFGATEKTGQERDLVWFELQICPQEFRFAAVPDQPVVFGYLPEDEEGVTYLIRYEGNKEVVDSLMESLDSLVRTHQIFDTPMRATEQVFQEEGMKTESLHIRIAYSDDNYWLSMYDLDDIPPNVQAFLEEAEQLGLELTEKIPSQQISGEKALELVNPEAQSKPETLEDLGYTDIAEIRVDRTGAVYLNGSVVTFEDLKEEIERLKEANGAVLYSRENPEEEPHPKAMEVMQLITEAKLPIQLSEGEFD